MFSIQVQYFILAFLVVYLSLKLSKYVDELDKKTNMSGAFIGGILLAAVTSLPEFITSISSVFLLNQPALVQGNVLGSNIFNLSIIAICIIFLNKKFRYSTISKSHIWTCICTIIMFIICYFGLNWNYIINLKFFNINLASILILILYFINLKKLNSEESTNNIDDSKTDLTINQIIIRFIILTILLVIVSIFLTKTTDRLNEKFNLGATIGGAVFLGVATSLPELTSSLNLARLGNFNASFGNIFGSNIFNFTILSISDLFYTKGNIFIKNNESINLIFWGIISSLISIFLLFNKKNRIASFFISALIILFYILSIYFSI